LPKHIYLNNSICDILKWIPSLLPPPPFYCTIPPDLTQKRQRQNVMTNLFRRDKKTTQIFSLSLLISDLIPRRKWQVEKKKKNANWFPFGINKFPNIKDNFFLQRKQFLAIIINFFFFSSVRESYYQIWRGTK